MAHSPTHVEIFHNVNLHVSKDTVRARGARVARAAPSYWPVVALHPIDSLIYGDAKETS